MRLAALVGVLCVGACATGQSRLAMGLDVDKNLLDFLAWAQTQVHSETVLCLTGDYAQGRITVDGVTAPLILQRTDSSVSYAGCRGRRVIGTWHPHSAQYAQYCNFSAPDRQTFAGSFLLLDLLGCGKGEFRFMVAADTTTYTLTRAP